MEQHGTNSVTVYGAILKQYSVTTLVPDTTSMQRELCARVQPVHAFWGVCMQRAPEMLVCTCTCQQVLQPYRASHDLANPA
eukprot:184425-Amphidinium_carterae.2